MILRDNPGPFKINDFQFPIDPVSISIAGDATLFNKNTLSTEGAILKTGHGDISLGVSWILASQVVETGSSLKNIVNMYLIPIYRYLSIYPFCLLDNKELDSIMPETSNRARSPLWVWRSMTVNVGDPLPKSTIGLDMTFEVCDTSAYLWGTELRKTLSPENETALADKWSKNSVKGLSFLVPDGVNVTKNTSFGALYTQCGDYTGVKSFEKCEPYQKYLEELIDGAYTISDDLSSTRLITLIPTEFEVVNLPSPPKKISFDDATVKSSQVGVGVTGGSSSPAGQQNQNTAASGGGSTSVNGLDRDFGIAVTKLLNKYNVIVGNDGSPGYEEYRSLKGHAPWIHCGRAARDGRGNHPKGWAVDIEIKGIHDYIKGGANQGDSSISKEKPEAALAFGLLGAIAATSDVKIYWGGVFKVDIDKKPFGDFGDYMHFQKPPSGTFGPKQQRAKEYFEKAKSVLREHDPKITFSISY